MIRLSFPANLDSRILYKSANIVKTQGKIATVTVKQQSACGTCSVYSVCGTSVLSKLFSRKSEFNVVNETDAVEGDEVLLSVSDTVLIKTSFMMYLLPLMCLFAGAILAEQLFSASPYAEALSILGGISGFVCGIWIFKLYATSLQKRSGSGSVVITKPNDTDSSRWLS